MVLDILIRFIAPYMENEISITVNQLELVTNLAGDSSKQSADEAMRSYKQRTVSWAIETIQDLIRPDERTNIPNLDALLSATGPHDGLAHEMITQRRFLNCGSKAAENQRQDQISQLSRFEDILPYMQQMVNSLSRQRASDDGREIYLTSDESAMDPIKCFKTLQAVELPMGTDENTGYQPFFVAMKDFFDLHPVQPR